MNRLLLVEDDPNDALLMIEALRESRIEVDVRVAEDGDRAFAILREDSVPGREWRPDLIVCDLQLAGVGGHELLRKLKSDPDLRRIPVVIMSGSRESIVVNLSYELHANCYIHKPDNFVELCAVTNSLLPFWFCTALLPKS